MRLIVVPLSPKLLSFLARVVSRSEGFRLYEDELSDGDYSRAIVALLHAARRELVKGWAREYRERREVKKNGGA